MCSQTAYYCDNDGFFSKFPAFCQGLNCMPSGCRAAVGNDCDDSNPVISPFAMEICNDGLDNNCNSLVDCEDFSCKESNWWVSVYGTNPCVCHPDIEEICDGIILLQLS